MRFWGTAKVANDGQLISDFANFIESLGKRSGNEGLLRIGTGRTRGMGKVAIDVAQPKVQQDPFESFQKRLNEFDDLLHQQAKYFNLSGLENKFFFALTLHSPLILHDD